MIHVLAINIYCSINDVQKFELLKVNLTEINAKRFCKTKNKNDKKLNMKIVTSSFCIFFLEFTDSLFGWEVDYFILVTFFNGKVNVFEEYILKRFVFGIT